MSLLPDTLLEQITQSIAAAVWNRPELTWLREPVQKALDGNTFALLAQQAFERLRQK